VANGVADSQLGPGRNYLELCERACGEASGDARNAAAGIRRVLFGQAPEFVFEYACHLPNEQRWFQLTATPLSENSLAGAVIMHSNITDRKLAEDRLGRQKGMLSSAVRLAGAGSWDYDIVNDRLEWGDVTIQIFGTCREAFGGRVADFFAFVHPSDRPALREVEAKVAQGNSTVEMEYRIIRPDGQIRLVHDRGEVMFDEQGRPLRSTGVVMDITERRRAEESIRLQAHILDSIGQGVIGRDREGRITYANRFAGALYGFLPEEMSGHDAREVANQELSEEQIQAIERRLRNGESWSGEIVVCTRDGRVFPVSITETPLLDKDGEWIGSIDISADISDRKRSERALRESEAKFRTLAEAMPQIVWMAQPNGSKTYFNQRWLDYTGLSLDESLGPGWLKAIHPDDRQRTVEAWNLTVDSGSVLERETRLRKADGSFHWMLVRGLPLYDSGANIVSWLGTCTDIEVLKQAERDLQRARGAAEAASQVKSDFLANISHELRTPMNGIIGFTELALGTQLTEEQREYLGIVKSSSDHLLSLLSEILDFSRTEANELRPETLPFRLRQTIDQALRPFVLEAGRKKLNFAWEVMPDVPDELTGDSTRLRQILVNLVANAIKFTEQGEVAVRIEVLHNREAEVMLHFSVRDTGIRVPAEKQGIIFEPFTQADTSATRKYGGTGLGLTIAARLVKMMGGQVHLESTEGAWSEFDFNLGFACQPAALSFPERRCADSPSPAAVGRRILLAEDNIVNQKVVARLLEKQGHAVAVASTGREALALLNQQAFDLVLMDIQMPDIDGFQVTAAIREGERESGKHIPILALTAHPMAGDRERCIQAGMDDYISKPIQPSDLWGTIECVMAHLANSSSRS
jgi:PAS domain S-box-containing protein